MPSSEELFMTTLIEQIEQKAKLTFDLIHVRGELAQVEADLIDAQLDHHSAEAKCLQLMGEKQALADELKHAKVLQLPSGLSPEGRTGKYVTSLKEDLDQALREKKILKDEVIYAKQQLNSGSGTIVRGLQEQLSTAHSTNRKMAERIQELEEKLKPPTAAHKFSYPTQGMAPNHWASSPRSYSGDGPRVLPPSFLPHNPVILTEPTNPNKPTTVEEKKTSEELCEPSWHDDREDDTLPVVQRVLTVAEAVDAALAKFPEESDLRTNTQRAVALGPPKVSVSGRTTAGVPWFTNQGVTLYGTEYFAFETPDQYLYAITLVELLLAVASPDLRPAMSAIVNILSTSVEFCAETEALQEGNAWMILQAAKIA